MVQSIYDALNYLANNGKGFISRFGCADKDGKILAKRSYVCFAAIREKTYTNAAYLFACWNGDPHGMKKVVEYDDGWGGDRDQPEKRKSRFTPGPFSDRWLNFLLDPDISPWKAIHEHLLTTDPVIIRSSGFIIKDPGKINFGLLYNFLIATRYAYEFNHRVQFWKELIDEHGVDPRAAYLLSISFKKDPKAVKPPLRKVLVREAGYRKNAGGFRYIRDEYGEKKYFPAEYKEVDDHPDWKPGAWDGNMRTSQGDGHCPLCTMYRYTKRILNSDPDLSGKTFGEIGGLGYGGPQAWDIFKTDGEPEYNGLSILNDVLAHFEKVK